MRCSGEQPRDGGRADPVWRPGRGRRRDDAQPALLRRRLPPPVRPGRSSSRLEPVEKHLRGVQWLNKPFLRGSLALIDAMALGIKALTYAANVQAQPIEAACGRRGEPGDGRRHRGESRSRPTARSTASPSARRPCCLWCSASACSGRCLRCLRDNLLPHAARLMANLAEGGIRLAIFFLYISGRSRR